LTASQHQARPIDAPSGSDWFVRGLSQAIGGPPGAHAVRERAGGPWRGRFWTAGRVVLALTCLTLALHWVQKSPCRDAHWTDLEQYTRFCYTDVIALYSAPGGLSQGGVPYLDYALEYPVLTGVLMAAIGLPVHHYGAERPWVNQHMWFYDLTALALLVFAVATVAMLLSMRRRRPWDVAMFALSPALLLTATVNWDLLAVVLAVGGVLAWARRRPVLAGVLLGLGTAAKLWPGFLFIPLVFLGIRAARNRPVWTSVATGVGTWLAVNAPVMIANFENWLRFMQLNTERAVDWGTLWYIGRYLDGLWRTGAVGERGPFQWLASNVDPYLNWTSYALFALACAGIAWLALRAPEPPRFAALAFLVVAAFLLTGKVWSQQFVLWLLPLLVLARPRWGAFLAWQVAEMGYFFAFYGRMLVASGRDILPEGVFVLAAMLRWAAVAALCVLVVRDILHPRQDAVRASYQDDPDAGVLAGSWPVVPGGACGDQQSEEVGGGSRVEVEDDRPADLLPDDAEPVAAGEQRTLPLGAERQVVEHHHRLHPE
jgi:hypothetical protein